MTPGSVPLASLLRAAAHAGATIAGGVLLSLCSAVQPAAAADPPVPLKPIRATTPPVIDGDLSDPIWQTAPTVTGFKTWTPDFGIDMKDQTVVYYAYDAENLYFAFRAFDSEPARIKSSIAARDSVLADDWVCINLDSFGDQQSLYGLYVNPLGIQADSRFAANREDVGFDAVWYSAGRIDDRGYTIEVRIPFKSLRYGGSSLVRMRLIFERRISRRSEQGTYPALDPKVGPNFLTQNIPIEFENIKHYTLLEVLPDATYNQQSTRPAGTLQRLSAGADAGVSVKYGVTAQLTLDGTYNPDFSQVEADAGQIDINRRYALFFPEKRPFFLEGRDSFNFAGADYGPLQAVVYTRTIGNPLAGAKLTGKLRPSDTLAAMYATDELVPSAVDGGSPRYAQAAIVRYKHALAGDAYVGGFYTGREVGSAFNRVFGADGTLRVAPASTVGFHTFGSSTRPEGAPVAAAGSALLANFQHDSRNINVYLGALNITRGFDTWSGYLTRAGVFQATASVTPRLFPKSDLWKRVDFPLTSDHIRDAASGLWEFNNSAGVTVVTARAVRVSTAYHHSSEVYLAQVFGTSGVQVSASAQLTNQLTVTATASRQDAIYYSLTPFGGISSSAAATVRYQPSDKWQAELQATYAGFTRPNGGGRLYDYTILRGKATFQFNKYVFLRGIAEYNAYYRQLVTDVLVSFTYIPGTVFHAGYGSLYENVRWTGDANVPGTSLIETRRGLFIKASYLWRM